MCVLSCGLERLLTAVRVIQYQSFDLVIGGLSGIGADGTFNDQKGIAYLFCPYTDGLAFRDRGYGSHRISFLTV